MQRGQASLEYVGVVALVAVALALVLPVAGGAGLADAVGGQVRRALCLVSGGDCLSREGPRACVTHGHEQGARVRASLGVVHLGGGRVALRELRSDGSVAVTVLEDATAGLTVMLGVSARAGRHGIKAGGELDAQGGGGYARVFVRPDAASADALLAAERDRDVQFAGAVDELRRLAGHVGQDGPRPDERVFELRAGAEATAALRAAGFGAQAGLLGEAAVGLRVDARTGERTLVLRGDGDLAGRLKAPLAHLAGDANVDGTLSVAFDRHHRPVRLGALGRATRYGDARLGPLASAGGQRVEVEARLDLDDAAAAQDLLDGLAGDPQAGARTARRLLEEGRVDRRGYRLGHEETVVRAYEAKLGVGASYQHLRVTEQTDLLWAEAREPDGAWAPNLDCELAA